MIIKIIKAAAKPFFYNLNAFLIIPNPKKWKVALVFFI
jgi:hypothetical protein